MKIIVVLLLCIIWNIFSCAHRVAPSGGPMDEIPPSVMKASPKSGTVNFPVKQKVTLQFSEWVDIKNAEKSITIFPTLVDGFKVTVKGKKIEITPEKEFADSTTYHIGVTAILTDLHGVSIGSPYDLFFSTGPFIDSGKVYGCIVDVNPLSVQPKVALFRYEQDTLSDTDFVNSPSYLTQTDSTGIFRFSHIRCGNYEIFSFIDKNNDNRLTPGLEAGYAPRQKRIQVKTTTVDTLVLFPITTDTLIKKVKSISAIAPQVIAGEWSEKLGDLITLYHPPREWKIISLDSAISAPRINEYIQVAESREFALQLSKSLTAGSYSLIYKTYFRFLSETDSVSQDSTPPEITLPSFTYDTIRFNGTIHPDTSRPQLKSIQPVNFTHLQPEIRIQWSKPVQVMLEKWFVADTLGDTVSLSIDLSYSKTTLIKPDKKLKTGRYYHFSLPVKYVADYNGNQPYLGRDTAQPERKVRKQPKKKDITLSFSTITAKNICYRLSGRASCAKPNNLRIWQFLPTGKNYSFFSKETGNNFSFDSIPAGTGTFRYFIDFNQDEKHTPGTLFPWKAPEPYYAFSDTIEARARWEIEGIELPDCEICQQNSSLPPQDLPDSASVK